MLAAYALLGDPKVTGVYYADLDAYVEAEDFGRAPERFAAVHAENRVDVLFENAREPSLFWHLHGDTFYVRDTALGRLFLGREPLLRLKIRVQNSGSIFAGVNAACQSDRVANPLPLVIACREAIRPRRERRRQDVSDFALAALPMEESDAQMGGPFLRIWMWLVVVPTDDTGPTSLEIRHPADCVAWPRVHVVSGWRRRAELFFEARRSVATLGFVICGRAEV